MAKVASELNAPSPVRPLPGPRGPSATESDKTAKSSFATLLDSNAASKPARQADRREADVPSPRRRNEAPPLKAGDKAQDTQQKPPVAANQAPKAATEAKDAQEPAVSGSTDTTSTDLQAIADRKTAESAADAKTIGKNANAVDAGEKDPGKAAGSDSNKDPAADLLATETAVSVVQPKLPDAPPVTVLPVPSLALSAAAPAPSAEPAAPAIAADGDAAGAAPTPADVIGEIAGINGGRKPTSAKAPAAPSAATAPPSPATNGATDDSPALTGNTAPTGKEPSAKTAIAAVAAEAQAPAKDDKAAPEPVKSTAEAHGAVKAGTDAMQPLGLVGTGGTAAGNTTQAPTAAAAPQTMASTLAVPIPALAVEIATQASAGKSHFDIRLDPPELGRINVRLEVDHDGSITSHIIADHADTLDLLKRDAPQLERALQQAGLKTGDNALAFSLNDQNLNRGNNTPLPTPQNTAQIMLSEDDPAPLEALRQGYGRLLGLGGGLDIRV